METRAREFLDLSARMYEQNKDKWEHLLKSIGLSFDEDIYNDTIIKIYDKLVNEEDIEKTEDEIIAYWYQSFVTNIKRDKKYARNAKKDDRDVIELLKDKEYLVGASHLYYPTIRLLLEKVKGEFEETDFQAFKMYYLGGYTFEQVEDAVGHNAKAKIIKMRKWLKENV